MTNLDLQMYCEVWGTLIPKDEVEECFHYDSKRCNKTCKYALGLIKDDKIPGFPGFNQPHIRQKEDSTFNDWYTSKKFKKVV